MTNNDSFQEDTLEFSEDLQTTKRKSKTKTLLKTALKIVISTALLYVVFSRIDKENFVENLRLMDFRYAPFILLFIILNYVVGAFRWKQLLIYKEAENVSVGYLVNLYFIGSFFNNFMPTSVGGDAYKMYQLGRKIGDSAKGISSTFMERFTGIIALVVVSYVGLVKTLSFWVELLPPSFHENMLLVLSFKILLFIGFWIAAALGFLSLRLLARKISFFQKINEALFIYRGQKKVLLVAFLTSFIVQFLSIFTQYFIFLALGVKIPIFYALFVFPVITLAGFFIPSLNGLGVQDVLYISFMGQVGVAESLAISASVLYHLSRLVVSLIGGVLYAMGKGE